MADRHPTRQQLTEAQADRVAAVFEEHRRFIESVARRHAVTEDSVPDIVQTVGLKVCQHLNGFRGESQIRTWLFRVTVNAARSHYGDHAKLARVQEALTIRPEPDQVMDPDHHVDTTRRLDALGAAVQRLRPIYRDAVLADFGNGSGTGAVQSDQNVKESSLRTRRHRAQQQLRRMLTDDTET